MTTQSSEAAMRVAREIWKLVPEWSIRGMWNIDGAVETLAQIIDREALASESGFVQHYIDALETQITTSEARNAELVAALEAIADDSMFEEWELRRIAFHALAKNKEQTDESK